MPRRAEQIAPQQSPEQKFAAPQRPSEKESARLLKEAMIQSNRYIKLLENKLAKQKNALDFESEFAQMSSGPGAAKIEAAHQAVLETQKLILQEYDALQQKFTERLVDPSDPRRISIEAKRNGTQHEIEQQVLQLSNLAAKKALVTPSTFNKSGLQKKSPEMRPILPTRRRPADSDTFNRTAGDINREADATAEQAQKMRDEEEAADREEADSMVDPAGKSAAYFSGRGRHAVPFATSRVGKSNATDKHAAKMFGPNPAFDVGTGTEPETAFTVGDLNAREAARAAEEEALPEMPAENITALGAEKKSSDFFAGYQNDPRGYTKARRRPEFKNMNEGLNMDKVRMPWEQVSDEIDALQARDPETARSMDKIPETPGGIEQFKKSLALKEHAAFYKNIANELLGSETNIKTLDDLRGRLELKGLMSEFVGQPKTFEEMMGSRKFVVFGKYQLDNKKAAELLNKESVATLKVAEDLKVLSYQEHDADADRIMKNSAQSSKFSFNTVTRAASGEGGVR